MLNTRIKRILSEELLREAASLKKIVNTITKNNPYDDGDSEIEVLIMADPTAVKNGRGRFVGKYWKWIYNQYKRGNVHEGDIPELRAALNTYNINKSQINKPIDSYKSLDELVHEIAQYDNSFKATRTLSKGEQELEKVYEDQYVVVYIPHTWRAARKIGGDTRWCTASSSDYRFNYYLNNYGGEYYDIIRKSDGAKFQLHVESDQFMDRDDHCTNFALVFGTRKEAEGLIGFLKSRGKDMAGFVPKTFFNDVEEKLANGVRPEDVFDYVDDFRDGFARVSIGGKCNFIGTGGELLSPNKWFDGLGYFNDGFAKVRIGGKFNYIGTDGELLSPNKWFDIAYDFNDGVAKVRIGEKWNYINGMGKLLSPNK